MRDKRRKVEKQIEQLREERREELLAAAEDDEDAETEGVGEERETVPLSENQRQNLADTLGIPVENTPKERTIGRPDRLPPLNAAEKSAAKGDGLTDEERADLSSLGTRAEDGDDGE